MVQIQEIFGYSSFKGERLLSDDLDRFMALVHPAFQPYDGAGRTALDRNARGVGVLAVIDDGQVVDHGDQVARGIGCAAATAVTGDNTFSFSQITFFEILAGDPETVAGRL